jgi:tetratricopeptide (TPR) repeat protein
MRRKSILAIILCFAILMVFPSVTVRAERTSYTYTYDYWGDDRESPDAYHAKTLLLGDDFGIGDFVNPQGMFVRNDRIYICDTGNNRIVILEKINETFELVDVVTEFTGDTKTNTLAGPQDIYVSEEGEMYICDTDNQRIVQIDASYHLIKEMSRPDDVLIDQTTDFLPMKVVVDKSGRVLVLVKNYNKGFVQYDHTGKFTGFIGANKVKYNMLDYVWKLFSTKAQRAQMEQFVPTEYNNLALDQDDFIYCTTSVFKENELKSDQAMPIRMLNAMGADILVKNGEYPPIGDLLWDNAGGVSGASKLIDVTALDNDTYYAIDRTRGRIFGYDSQGNLLYAFGSLGNKLGYFQYPVALDHMGNDLLVLDSKGEGITILELTQYGQYINQALAEYKNGQYDLSAEYWEKVLMQNGNYDMAYIGIGRSLLRQGHYKKAMEYFELKYDDDNYSKAYKLYRKDFIEEHIGLIFILFFGVILTPMTIGAIKRIKREVDEA